MSGFFRIDIDDFDEFWSLRQNQGLFTVYAALKRRAWRQKEPKQVQEHQYRVTLQRNQLILNIRKLALQIDLADSTLRDRLGKLEMLEAIRVDKPVPGISIVTILWAYDYPGQNERIPWKYCAPSVVDLRTGRDLTEYAPPQELAKELFSNALQESYTHILEDSENQSKLVRRESSKDRDETDESRGIDDEDFPSDAEINMQINEICGVNPELLPGQVEEWAKSNQPIESILGRRK